jgi:hypothetical protein
VWSTIGRLVAAEAGEDTQRPVRIRVRAADGSWAVIDAARLDSNREIAVSIHAAGIDEILVLVSRAYGLSNRQRELVTLVAQGQHTPAIAGQMFISHYGPSTMAGRAGRLHYRESAQKKLRHSLGGQDLLPVLLQGSAGPGRAGSSRTIKFSAPAARGRSGPPPTTGTSYSAIRREGPPFSRHVL